MYYDKQKEYIAGIDSMKTVTKNDKLKVLKAFLNFGEKRYGYNFHQVLLNMERFKNPDELVSKRLIMILLNLINFQLLKMKIDIGSYGKHYIIVV